MKEIRDMNKTLLAWRMKVKEANCFFLLSIHSSRAGKIEENF